MRIGIDLGGHTIGAGRIETACTGCEEAVMLKQAETPEGRSIADTMRAIAAIVADLSGGDSPDVVGVAIPSMVDVERRHILEMPNFPREWQGIDFVASLTKNLREDGISSTVKIENDANCYALGEGVRGAARGLSDYVVFTMGTGIGCGIVINGRLLIGSHGMAGECGHVVVGGDAPCGCGGHGHAETIAASDGTTKRSIAAGLPESFKDLWALRGSRDADAVIDQTIDAMARAVSSTVVTLDPQAVVIGGGMSAASGLVEAIAERARYFLSNPFKTKLDLRRSTLGNSAAIYGAAAL